MNSDDLIDLLKHIHARVPIVEVSIRREQSRWSLSGPKLTIDLKNGAMIHWPVDDEGAEKVRAYAETISS